jgi:hypothetical protein
MLLNFLAELAIRLLAENPLGMPEVPLTASTEKS